MDASIYFQSKSCKNANFKLTIDERFATTFAEKMAECKKRLFWSCTLKFDSESGQTNDIK